jgi:hypothetical protein
MRRSIACIAVALGFVTLLSAVPASAKTARECNEEYAASKAAIKDTGQKKKEFIAACRAGTETVPGGGAAAPASTQTTPTAAPAPAAPAPAPAPTVNRQRAPAPTQTTGPPPDVNQSASEAEAKARCPAETVVWVNTKSKVYHFAGSREYGKTKRGAYMCESQATAAGDRAAKKEKHP